MSPDIPLKILEWLFEFGLLGLLLGMMFLVAIIRGWAINVAAFIDPNLGQAAKPLINPISNPI